MTNEKVFNYVGTSGKPLYSVFDVDRSLISFIDGTRDSKSLRFAVFDGWRDGRSISNQPGYYVGTDWNGKNMITAGSYDVDSLIIKILEVYEIN